MPLSGFEGMFTETIEAPEHARRLKMVLDCLPVGILLAAAPEGRIVFGNHMIQTLLGHPVRYSKDMGSYNEWIAFHEDGKQVESHEYPLARVLRGEQGPTMECHYRRGDGSRLWIKINGGPLYDKEGKLAGAVVCVTEIEAMKQAQARERLMHMELHHRMNNALAMIQSITNLSARYPSAEQDFHAAFSGRVGLLSRTQVLLSKSSWATIPMNELVATALPETLGYSQIEASGCDLSMRSDVALALGLALHELKTNSAKFGALTESRGHVGIHWGPIEGATDNQHLVEWRETGGPATSPPKWCGLGLELLQNILPMQIGGPIKLEFEPRGLIASIVVRP
jgi:PAS domain S-box-containing protein